MAAHSSDLAAPLVLVVEDVHEQLQPALEFLRAQGYRVECATNGAEAVRAARRLQPDAVILDLGLPIIDGWEAMRLIRRLPLTRQPRLIVLSALVDARSRQLAFEAGCDEFITKPCGLDTLSSALRAYFTKRDGSSTS